MLCKPILKQAVIGQVRAGRAAGGEQQKASAGSADLATTGPSKDSRRLQTPFCSLKENQT